jgi:hypothetical protein
MSIVGAAQKDGNEGMGKAGLELGSYSFLHSSHATDFQLAVGI